MEGQRVLILENCCLMADILQDILTAGGATVVGAANGTALRMIEALQIDVACLDDNLGCEKSLPLRDNSRPVATLRVRHRHDAKMLPPIIALGPWWASSWTPFELVRACATDFSATESACVAVLQKPKDPNARNRLYIDRSCFPG